MKKDTLSIAYLFRRINIGFSGKPPRLSAARYDPKNLTKLMPLQGDMDRDVVQSFIHYISTTPREELERSAPLMS